MFALNLTVFELDKQFQSFILTKSQSISLSFELFDNTQTNSLCFQGISQILKTHKLRCLFLFKVTRPEVLLTLSKILVSIV